MKILENISSGYKRIATGIAIVAFLALMYFALIPAGSFAGSGVFALSGSPIGGALVKLVDYPQYNATTAEGTGLYTMLNVPYGEYSISAQAPGYTKNKSMVNLSSSSVTKDFSLTEGSITGDYRYFAMIDNELASNKVSTMSDVGTNFTIPQYGDNVGFQTDVYITDYSGLGANLTLEYYYPNGTLAVIENSTVPTNGTYKWTPSNGTNGRPISGKLVITSTRNITGEYKIYGISSTDMMSNKLYTKADEGTNLTIPQYGDNVAFGTYIAISDVSGIGANMTLQYYYPNGSLAVIEYPNITANGMYQSVISDGTNGRPTSGKLEIKSNNPVNGEYRIFSYGTFGILANKLYTSADKRTAFTIPQYGDHVGFDTYIAISDVSGAGATLTLDYYYPNGTLAVRETPIISPNGIYETVASDGTNGKPTTGKLLISSNNLVSGEMRIFSLSGRGIMANSLFTQPNIGNALIVPYYGNNINYGTYLVLADYSGYNTTVRVDYHYLNGTLAKTENQLIPADGLLGWVPSDGANGKPTEGNMFISIT